MSTFSAKLRCIRCCCARCASRALLVFFLGIVTLLIDSAYSQEKSTQFFQRDFAKGVAVTQQSAGETGNLEAGRAQELSDPAAKHAGIDATRAKGVKEVSDSLSTMQRVTPAPTLMVIVNSEDRAHLTQVLNKVLHLQSKGTFLFSEVAHIGDYRTAPHELVTQLGERGIAYYALAEPPFGLSLTTSPAWIFTSLAGVRVVEGTMAIEKFVSPLGQYREPSWEGSAYDGTISTLGDNS
jgi:hypothetical protein